MVTETPRARYQRERVQEEVRRAALQKQSDAHERESEREVQRERTLEEQREREREARAAKVVAAQLDVFEPAVETAGVFDNKFQSDEFKASPPARQRRF